MTAVMDAMADECMKAVVKFLESSDIAYLALDQATTIRFTRFCSRHCDAAAMT